jgi:hypothetical protein
MSLQQTYYLAHSLPPYTSCSYAVYLDKNILSSISSNPTTNSDAVLGDGTVVQTNPPWPTNIGNILYIPAATSNLDTLELDSLYREAHSGDIIPANPQIVVKVNFPSAQIGQPLRISVTKQGNTIQVVLAP